MRSILLFSCFLLLLPFSALAETADLFDPYYARNASRRAGDLQHLLAQAQFLSERLGPISSMPPLSLEHWTWRDQHILCSLRRSLPIDRGAGFLQVFSEQLTAIFPSRTPQEILIAFLRTDRCPTVRMGSPKKPVQISFGIQFDERRRVISKNPVWNACVRRENLSVDLIRSNVDTFVHRQGRILKRIPYSCRDYHRGPQNLWHYPDQPGVQLYLDHSARLIGIDRSSIEAFKVETAQNVFSK